MAGIMEYQQSPNSARIQRGQQKADTTQRILTSAIRCFGRQGYVHASMAHIAKDAGVTAPLLVSRFGSKEGMLEAAYDQACHWFRFKMPQDADAAERLSSYLDTIRTMQVQDPDIFAFIRAVLLFPDMPQSFQRVRAKRFAQTAIKQAVVTAQAKGQLPGSDPWAVFNAFFITCFTHLDVCAKTGIPAPANEVFLAAVGYDPDGSAGLVGEDGPVDETSPVGAAVPVDEASPVSAAAPAAVTSSGATPGLSPADRQRLLAEYVGSRSDLSAIFDLEEGVFEVISAGGEYAGPLSGSIDAIYQGTATRVLPEFLEEYQREMSLSALRAKAVQAPDFGFQTFVRNADGAVSRKTTHYHVMDDAKRHVLVVREDTTEAYQRELALSQARGAASSSNLPTSEFLNQVIASKDGRRRILVVEDSEINREILSEMLSSEYDVICAADGQEGIQKLREAVSTIDLVLLDVYMPVCDGFRFLEMAQSDPALQRVPVVVATGSNHHEDEERCLKLGAVDFVTKPYDAKSLMERIRGAIRVSVSAETIASIETDPVTGLYTIQAFTYHAQRRLLAQDSRYSLALVDIVDFATVNSIHGEHVGDQVLEFVGAELAKTLPRSLICRTGGWFLILFLAGQPVLREMLSQRIDDVRASAPVPNLRIRVGICEDLDPAAPIVAHCDRAKLAAQSLARDAKEQIAFFDQAMEAKKARELKMLSDFDKALADGEFVPFIQPKVNSGTGRIEAGEALVRWFDAQGNFISPGDFVPLFEREGCIKDLDQYIFAQVCRYQRNRLQQGLRVVPISVNLSRNSLFSPGIAQRYRSIVDEAGISCSLVPLEITESAATSDALISDVCNSLVSAGFGLHMDDFGAGYSSLSSLVSLPFEVLKLDKSLIDSLQDSKGAVVIRNAVETARDLGMRIVAEGVEERPQVEQLAKMGCSLIQGYYFAAPMGLSAFDAVVGEDAPYGEKATSVTGDATYLCMNEPEFRRFLAIARTLFPMVRVLDAGCQKVCLVDESGRQRAQAGNCYDAWGRSQRCENCTSLAVAASKSTLHKFELMDGEAYLVFSRYVEVEGVPQVVELIDKVGSGIVHGLEGAPSLMDAVASSGGEIYRDVQLGTLNRRFFEEKIEGLEGVSAIAFVDVDDLKVINDTQGHDGGDRLLKTVADVLGHSVCKSDYVIRVGGDEFLVAFAGMRNGILEEKLQSISTAVHDAGASVSIGGCYVDHVTPEAVKAADRAMYEAKQSGSGVCMAECSAL